MPSARSLALSAALAISSASSIGAADPALPKGWIAGSGALLDPPSPKRREIFSLQSNHEFTFATRPSFRGRTVDLPSLPLVELPRSKIPEALPNTLPEGPLHDILVIKKGSSRRVTIQGFEAGFVQLGRSIPQIVGRQSEGGASTVCVTNGIESLSYEAIRRVDERGTLLLVWGRGYLDNASCRAVILERHEAKPQHIAGGVLFLFRSHCAECAEGSRDVLHVITPQMGSSFDQMVAFEHRTFAYGPGKSAAFEGTSFLKLASKIGSWSMPDFDDLVRRDCAKGERFCTRRLRLEVSQGEGEGAPTLFIGGTVISGSR